MPLKETRVRTFYRIYHLNLSFRPFRSISDPTHCVACAFEPQVLLDWMEAQKEHAVEGYFPVWFKDGSELDGYWPPSSNSIHDLTQGIYLEKDMWKLKHHRWIGATWDEYKTKGKKEVEEEERIYYLAMNPLDKVGSAIEEVAYAYSEQDLISFLDKYATTPYMDTLPNSKRKVLHFFEKGSPLHHYHPNDMYHCGGIFSFWRPIGYADKYIKVNPNNIFIE